jgi:hypothetical protein
MLMLLATPLLCRDRLLEHCQLLPLGLSGSAPLLLPP